MISQEFLHRLWYEEHPLAKFLVPFSWVYCAAIQLRHAAFISGMLPCKNVDIPVIIVGNISVGGTGKTPLIIWLSDYLIRHGYRPGIISRGYGGKPVKRPQQVRPDSNPLLVGDEPVLLARRTGCPVAVSAKRYTAARELLEHTDCNILLLDDGLQHLSLDRDMEIAAIDGDRRFGNGYCLPAGPLREPVSRLSSVDIIVSTGKARKNEHLMLYEYGDLYSLYDGNTRKPGSLGAQEAHVVTGIGNPSRMYSYLRSCNIRLIRHEYPDHYRFTPGDVFFDDDLPVVMTEKDAVKCEAFATKNMWYLPIRAILADTFEHRLAVLLKEITDGQETA